MPLDNLPLEQQIPNVTFYRTECVVSTTLSHTTLFENLSFQRHIFENLPF